MTKDNQSSKENGIDKEIELQKSLKDKELSFDHLLKEMNQSQQVEQVLNRYGLSTKKENATTIENNAQDHLSEQIEIRNQFQNQTAEVDFEPISNRSINSKREKLVKRFAYAGVAVFGFFFLLGVVGAYIDFYNYYTTNDADYLKANAKEIEVEN